MNKITKKGSEAEKRRETKLDKQDQKSLALWAADCAEHVLPYFKKEHPRDDRL